MQTYLIICYKYAYLVFAIQSNLILCGIFTANFYHLSKSYQNAFNRQFITIFIVIKKYQIIWHNPMSQGEHSGEQQKIKTLSSRHVGLNRDYGCPCGKFYLSYTALYSHVKTKHAGNPPGTLIRPKATKIRGRPKSILLDHEKIKQTAPQQNSDQPFQLHEQISKILMNNIINYTQIFDSSEGTTTIQDMASKFIQQLKENSPQQIKTIKCFLNELKQFLDSKYGQNYWKQNQPSQLVDIANQFYHSHESRKQKYPLNKQTIIQLTFLLFKWMYKNKWTNHKLVKRNEQLGLSSNYM